MASALELVNPEYAEIRKLEEDERRDRIVNSDRNKQNAIHVAHLLEKANYPVIVYPCRKGSWKIFKCIEERERERRIAAKDEVVLAKRNACLISGFVEGIPSKKYCHKYKGTNKFMRRMEEIERKRRLENQEEEVLQMKRAKTISDCIRSEGPTVRARLIKRKPVVSAWEKGKEAISAVWKGVTQNAVHMAAPVAETASAVRSYIPSADNVVHSVSSTTESFLHTAKEAVMHSVQQLTHHNQAGEAAEVVVDLKFDVGQLEEEERKRRVNDKEEVRLRQENARIWVEAFRNQVIFIMDLLSTPHTHITKASSAWEKGKHIAEAGWKSANSAVDTARHAVDAYMEKATSAAKSIKETVLHALYYYETALSLENAKILEEAERERRIREDDASIQGNAWRLAKLIKRQQFPYFTKAKSPKVSLRYVHALEERERKRRLANRDEALVRQLNAGYVSNLLVDLGWPLIRHTCSTRVFFATSVMEEDERLRRIQQDSRSFVAIANARKISSLIKNASTVSNRGFMKAYTKRLEEEERKRRMHNPDRAIHNAHRLADVFASYSPRLKTATPIFSRNEVVRHKLDSVENEERKRRMTDTAEQKRARKKARKLSQLIRTHNKETEDTSRVQILKNKEKREQAQDLADTMASIMLQDIHFAEECERKSRLMDKRGQFQARLNANKVSGMILAHNKSKELDKKIQETLAPMKDATSEMEKIELVREFRKKEWGVAKKEEGKAGLLKEKGGWMKNFRLKMHESSAERHMENVRNCEAWLTQHLSRQTPSE